jgi:hypothetical protein
MAQSHCRAVARTPSRKPIKRKAIPRAVPVAKGSRLPAAMISTRTDPVTSMRRMPMNRDMRSGRRLGRAVGSEGWIGGCRGWCCSFADAPQGGVSAQVQLAIRDDG